VNYLENESVIDYLLVHGDNINSLVVQSFVKPEKITSGILAQTSILIDAMAAFCRIKTTEELHKVTTFKSNASHFRVHWGLGIRTSTVTETHPPPPYTIQILSAQYRDPFPCTDIETLYRY